jgi:hypothetical protein
MHRIEQEFIDNESNLFSRCEIIDRMDSFVFHFSIVMSSMFFIVDSLGKHEENRWNRHIRSYRVHERHQQTWFNSLVEEHIENNNERQDFTLAGCHRVFLSNSKYLTVSVDIEQTRLISWHSIKMDSSTNIFLSNNNRSNVHVYHERVRANDSFHR